MVCKIKAYTTEDGSPFDIDLSKKFSGKQAGICYMKDKYEGNVVNPEKAAARFTTVCDTGHHSISDHVYITVLMEGIPKMLAIILNSLQAYNTSEKSGRYTKMTGNSHEEVALYEKWLEIFKPLLKMRWTEMDDKTAEKMAMENARFMLSVFTPTTMSYTASIRMWNYIYDWSEKLVKKLTTDDFFNQSLSAALKELMDFIKENIYIKELRDIKNKDFDFLVNYSDNAISSSLFDSDSIRYGLSYITTYKASAVALAQNERHRTLKYNIYIPFHDMQYYVPQIIRNTDYEKEWLKDLNSVSDKIPQAILFDVLERGTAENFVLKCKERVCGRAQEEVRNITINTLKDFYSSVRNKSDVESLIAERILSECFRGDSPKLKCQMLSTCKEPCIFRAELLRSL